MSSISKSTQETLAELRALPDIARVRLPVVAALYACHPSTVRRHAAAGAIPQPQKHGGVLTWRVGDLRRALRG